MWNPCTWWWYWQTEKKVGFSKGRRLDSNELSFVLRPCTPLNHLCTLPRIEPTLMPQVTRKCHVMFGYLRYPQAQAYRRTIKMLRAVYWDYRKPNQCPHIYFHKCVFTQRNADGLSCWRLNGVLRLKSALKSLNCWLAGPIETEGCYFLEQRGRPFREIKVECIFRFGPWHVLFVTRQSSG